MGRWARIVIIAVLAAGIGYLVWRGSQPGSAAPGFVLHDQNGQLTSLAQFRGKVVALTFLDPECQQICPLTSETLLRALPALGPAAANVEILGVNVNAADSNSAALQAYTREHGMDRLGARWRFLSGSPAQLARVWHDYNIHVAVAEGDIQHEAEVILIDPAGRERAIEPTLMSYGAVSNEAQIMARDINRLLPAQGPVQAVANAGHQAPTPLASFDLVDFEKSGVPVQFGAGHAHLAVFFARWQAPAPELAQKLAPLGAYAAAAGRRNWPMPVAVDELSTEPSPERAQAGLAALGAATHVPMVADETGELADDLQVGDLPWYVLTSPAGAVVWSHDGWLSADALNHAVAAALSATAGAAPRL